MLLYDFQNITLYIKCCRLDYKMCSVYNNYNTVNLLYTSRYIENTINDFKISTT